MKKWVDGEELFFKHPVTGVVTPAKMYGFATNDHPTLGRGIIVKPLDIKGEFTMGVVFEAWVLGWSYN